MFFGLTMSKFQKLFRLNAVLSAGLLSYFEQFTDRVTHNTQLHIQLKDIKAYTNS